MLTDWNVPFRALVDAAPDGMLVCDQRGTLVLANGETERMFGYAHEELVGKPVEMLIPMHARGRHEHHVASYTAAPRLRPMGSDLDLRGRRKDGSEFPVEISLSPFTTDRGVLIIAGIRDVTDRRRLERDAKRANAYLVSAVDAVQEAFTLFDEQDRVMMVNSTARVLLAPAGDIIGHRFEDVLQGALASGVFDFSDETRDALYRRWIDYHHSPSGTLEVRTGTGRYLRVTERKTADHGMVSMIADVTDDVERSEELGRARERADAASAAKSEFLSSMSHELRTPLNAILGFAQLLERDRKRPLDERQLDRLGHVLRGGEHLLRLIDDVLDLSHIEAGRISVSNEPVDVVGVVAEVAHTLEPMAGRAQIELIVEPAPARVPRVVVDRTRLSQILMNLGSNAIKYSKPNGHVSIRIEELHGAVRVTVIDDGIGIPADKLDKIFEPFQRAGQETGPIEGTGIGLTISKRLAELMGSTIELTTEVGHGSSFWLDLPVYKARSQPIATVLAPLHASMLASTPRRHRVVYVEDNPSNVAFMRELMDDLPSVELFTAPSAELGIELIRTHLPHVVIMDINLPGMSGFDAVKRLRDWPETARIPVIGLSAAAQVKDTARATEAGFHRYLTKPVKVDELTTILEELLVDP